MKQIGVGILGFGTVGAGVADGLLKHREVMANRLGVDIVLKKVADLDITTDRGVAVPADVLTTDAKSVVTEAGIDIVVETIGGTGIAKTLVLSALENGKCVVTANKKLLAEYGREIFDTAARNNVDIYFGASVGGGIPIIRVLREGLAGNCIESIHGILNGTCNYILTRMEREGLPFGDVLKDAQRLGYAEADPSLDIDGFDTAHKACILAALAFGFQPSVGQVRVEGIRNLAGVNDAFNAVMVKGDMSGYTMYYGRGAGRAPTASTVVGDIGDIARNLAKGETRYARAVPTYGEGSVKLRPAGEIRSKFYIRFQVADRPGAFGTIASILGKRNVSISAASQKAGGDGTSAVPVVVLTHAAKAADLDAALSEIRESGVIAGDPVSLRIL